MTAGTLAHLPFVLGPELAIDKIPGPVCLSWKFSSANFSPNMLSPPVPFPLVKSPPWHMKSGITRWKLVPLKCRGLPLLPAPFSPVQRQRKFSAVRGTTSARRVISIRPVGRPPILMSKNTTCQQRNGWGLVHWKLSKLSIQVRRQLQIRSFTCALADLGGRSPRQRHRDEAGEKGANKKVLRFRFYAGRIDRSNHLRGSAARPYLIF